MIEDRPTYNAISGGEYGPMTATVLPPVPVVYVDPSIADVETPVSAESSDVWSEPTTPPATDVEYPAAVTAAALDEPSIAEPLIAESDNIEPSIAEPLIAEPAFAEAVIAVAAPAEVDVPLFEPTPAAEFRTRWLEIQTSFVDEPRQAVEHADGLVSEVMDELARTFADERSKVEPQLASGDELSTEDLRTALRRYRSFFDRLLSI